MYPEDALRLGMFGGVLLVMALGELLCPRRALTVDKPRRWLNNLGLVCLNSLLVRLLVPVSTAGLALLAQERSWGLLNNYRLPAWWSLVLAVVALDFVIYLQHVLFHAVPALWRLHLVHHADLDFDVSTGLRFHTLEIVLSLGIKLAAIALLGPSPSAVLVFEILLNATAMFNHANVRLPAALDRLLRGVVVTPDMHRVHHSARVLETNSNYGFNLPWWDYLFGTYRAQPLDGHEAMTIGLTPYRDEHQVERLPGILALPFAEAYAAPRGDACPNAAAQRR